MACYSYAEYAAVRSEQCCAAMLDTSAVMFLYDNIDTCCQFPENHYRNMKCPYSVVIVAVVVKSTSVSLCDFREAVLQLADGLPDDVIANGVVINVSVLMC